MLSEALWGRLAPLLPPQKPWTGRPSLDHRRFLEAVLWLARTGAPWRDLPPGLMNWRTAWRRLQRWTAAGVWGRVLEALRAMAPEAGWDAHMLDSTVVRAHAHAAGARHAPPADIPADRLVSVLDELVDQPAQQPQIQPQIQPQTEPEAHQDQAAGHTGG